MATTDRSAENPSRLARRELGLALVSLTLTGCLSSESQQLNSTPIPAVSLARPNAQASAETAQVTEQLDPLFNSALIQAEQLVRTFPREFATAGNLREKLTTLSREKRLAIKPKMDGYAEVIPGVGTNPNNTIATLTPLVNIKPELLNLQPAEQVIILSHELGHENDMQVLFGELIKTLAGRPYDETSKKVLYDALLKAALILYLSRHYAPI